jgi:hypothetical protein
VNVDEQTRVVTGEHLELATYIRAHTHTHTHTRTHTPPITHPCRVLPTAPPKWPQRLIPPVPLVPLQKQKRKKRGKRKPSRINPPYCVPRLTQPTASLRSTTAPAHSSLTHVGPWPSHPCLNISCAPCCVLPSPERQSLIYVVKSTGQMYRSLPLLLPIRTYNYY